MKEKKRGKKQSTLLGIGTLIHGREEKKKHLLRVTEEREKKGKHGALLRAMAHLLYGIVYTPG